MSELKARPLFRKALRTMLTSAYNTCWSWVVAFMLRVRFASPYVSSSCASGFWVGMAVGRIVLGFATERCGERWSVVVYLAFVIALEVVSRVVTSIALSLVTVTFLGFFL